MAILVHPVATAGSVTQPTTTFRALLPSAGSERWHGGAPISTCRLPFRQGIASTDGLGPVRVAYDDTISDVSILAPSAAPTATPSGARATAVLDLDVSSDGSYAPAVGEQILFYNDAIEFVDTFSGETASRSYEVLREGTVTATLDNLRDCVEGNLNTHGTKWQVGGTFIPFGGGSFTEDAKDKFDAVIEVTAKDATSISFRVRDYGTAGNAHPYRATLFSGTWTDCDFGSNGSTVGGLGYFEGGTNGAGDAPSAGTFRYCYTYFRSSDGAESGRSPEATASQGTPQGINLASLSDPSPADASIDFIRIYRTEDDGAEFFRVAEIATGGAGTYTDTTADGETDGSLQGYGNVPFDDLAHKRYRGGMAPRGKVCAHWGSRLWTGGAWILEDYSVGTASVTNDSASVTLSTDAVPTDDMRFNEFSVSGDSETYIIQAVAEATRVLTLDRPYQGSTAGTASYTVKDTRDAGQPHASEEGLYNQWPIINQPGGVDPSDNDEGITAFWPTRDALVMWSETGMHRITGEGPGSWATRRVGGGKGCVSQAAVVERGNVIYWVSPDSNVYAWAQGGTPVSISSPDFDPANTTPYGIDRTMARINWKHKHLISGQYCQRTQTISWAVPLDDNVAPNHHIVFDVSARRWLTDTGMGVASSAAATGTEAAPVCLVGDFGGHIWHVDLVDATNCDGAFGFEPVQTLTAATVNSLTVGSSVFPTSDEGLAGVPVTVVYAAGTIAYGKVASNTGTVLTLEADLETAPAADDQVIVGCVPAIWRSGRFTPSNRWDRARLKTVQITHQKDSDGEFHYAYASDEDTALKVAPSGEDSRKGDFTDNDRATRIRFDYRTYGAQIQLTTLEPGLTDAAFVAFSLDVEGRG